MQASALLGAWFRAVPLALCLPLPGLQARLALGLVLGLVGAGGVAGGLRPEHLPLELAIGLALGLGAAAPVWAARWAGGLVGYAVGGLGRTLATIYTVLAWLSFLGVGGGILVARAYASSYLHGAAGAAPRAGEGLVEAGSALVAMAASLALPSLLALAGVELAGALVARFERSAGLAAGAQPIVRGARPLVAVLLLLASLATFSQIVSAATRAGLASATSR